jgi:hypothetical protein
VPLTVAGSTDATPAEIASEARPSKVLPIR